MLLGMTIVFNANAGEDKKDKTVFIDRSNMDMTVKPGDEWTGSRAHVPVATGADCCSVMLILSCPLARIACMENYCTYK